MPLYDYRCSVCGREVEVMHGIHADGPDACEACGGAMSKVLSPPTIHFKGSGWAKKDAATATAKKAKPKGSAASTSSTKEKGAESGTSSPSAGEKAGSGDASGAKTTASTGTTTD